MSNINHQVEWVNNHKILLSLDFDTIVYRNAKSGKKRRALKFFREAFIPIIVSVIVTSIL